MTMPSPQRAEAMRAFLGGYLDRATAITVDAAKTILRRHFPDVGDPDGMMVARMLRRHGFARSYDDRDAGTRTYRRVANEDVPY